MTDPINFDIEGLAAKYELHPEWQDVFVEGESDQGLVRTFLEYHGEMNCTVFPISVVNIPPSLVLQRSLPHPSARSAVLTLALELQNRGVRATQVACIADADFEHLLHRSPGCPLLLLTDFVSMEIYAYSEKNVNAVLLLVSPTTSMTGRKMFDELTGPLNCLFEYRATNADLEYGLPWPKNLEEVFGIEGEKIEFDEPELCRKYVEIHLPSDKRRIFLERLRELRLLACSDPRLRIHGHDFVRILTWYFRKKEKCTHLKEKSVLQMLYLALRPEELTGYVMFSALLGRMRR